MYRAATTVETVCPAISYGMIAVAWLLPAYKIGGCHAVENDRDVSGDRGIKACVIVSGYDRLRRAQVRSRPFDNSPRQHPPVTAEKNKTIQSFHRDSAPANRRPQDRLLSVLVGAHPAPLRKVHDAMSTVPSETGRRNTQPSHAPTPRPDFPPNCKGLALNFRPALP